MKIKLVMILVVATFFAKPMIVNAGELRAVSCSVTLNYLLEDVVRAPYQNDFVVDPGVVYEDDFSTLTRFRVFSAQTRLDEVGNTVVKIDYFNDVGVFESVDFNTELTIHDEKNGETASGSHSYWSSLGVAGNHTTNYKLTCKRIKA